MKQKALGVPGPPSPPREKLEHKIILSKTNESYFHKPLYDGYCRFFYKTHENSEWITFQDKCEKYNVGDTIH